ncbi:hypothetical protein OIU91_41500 (plasmid) [Streptomyces sp. NBC_01456]|uniref:multiple cyclophane-containing RiPP AmcA n=1 Tax=unclassified Streptomyces TaxID=2593676 RepID=UPI002E341973|nr:MULTISPECIES: multiple cyclophane-containing RiPP AmcA [unclassified Streptomyces]
MKSVRAGLRAFEARAGEHDVLTPAIVEAAWDNRPTWDNWAKYPASFDNRPTWDNWYKKT